MTTFHKWAGSLVVVALLTASGSAPASTVLPAPEALPRNTVVVVSHVSTGLGRITRAEFQRALGQSAAVAGRSTTPKPGGNGYGKLKDTAMGELLDRVWIEGQAAEMGIKITSGQVSRRLARLKRQAFKSEAAYHEFLEESHYTRRDVRERVRVQMLASRIQEKVQKGARTESEMYKAFREFVAEYEERWRARTVCVEEFATVRCSNGPLPPDGRTRPQPEALGRGF